MNLGEVGGSFGEVGFDVGGELKLREVGLPGGVLLLERG